jgi:hypothetical protein
VFVVGRCSGRLSSSPLRYVAALQACPFLKSCTDSAFNEGMNIYSPNDTGANFMIGGTIRTLPSLESSCLAFLWAKNADVPRNVSEKVASRLSLWTYVDTPDIFQKIVRPNRLQSQERRNRCPLHFKNLLSKYTLTTGRMQQDDGNKQLLVRLAPAVISVSNTSLSYLSATCPQIS